MPAFSMNNLDQPYQAHPQVVDTELDDGDTVLLHLESKMYYTLNSTGGRIWHDLKQGSTPRQISLRLREEFEVDEQGAARSVAELLQELCEQDLLQKVE